MEERREEIMNNLVEDRLKVLNQQKARLEEQITNDTAGETDHQEIFIENRREKLAEVIKEIKILSNEGINTDPNAAETRSSVAGNE